jgi:hypothetical protein
MKAIHLLVPLLFFASLPHSQGADINTPAVFSINQVVAAPNPGAWTATVSGGTVNEVNSGGGFEPLVFKTRWRATGNAANSIILPDTEINGWDSYNEGFYKGSTVRIYRAVNDQIVKVREDTIAEHHVKAWQTYGDQTINAGVNTCQISLPGWYNPNHTYYFSVVAVDHNGNCSAHSNAVSAQRNAVTGNEPVNAEHSFTAPASPTETTPPAAPGNLAISLNATTGIFTLTWQGVADADLEGYRVYISYWPPAEHTGLAIELAGQATDPWQHVRAGDMIYVDRTRLEWNPQDVISPRLYGDSISGFPSYWPWSIGQLNSSRVQHLVPHPGPIPAEFTERGQSCLHVSTTIPDDEVRLSQYNHAGTNQTWYPVLEVGATYVVEAWMRQEGIPGGIVTFSLQGDYGGLRWNDPTDTAYVPPIDFSVTGGWAKYTATFTITGPYNEEGVGTTQLAFNGPGQLWLDNFRVYKQGTAFMDWPQADYDALAAAKLGSIRTHQFIKSGWSYTMEELTNPAGVRGGRGNDTSQDHTLPHMLGILERAGINPWLQIETSQSEGEWLGFIEYLAAPYDPAVDTPQSKPWAYKRYSQGHPAPWADSFSRIYFEISNEMWNGMRDFTPWSINGVTMLDSATGTLHGGAAIQGMLQNYIDSVIKSSPYWPRLQNRWEVVVGGWNGNTGEDHWGFAAVKKCPDIKHVTWANYNGGWDEGAAALTADNQGRFLALSAVPHDMNESNKAFAQAREDMAAKGYFFDIGTYEAGPGYSLNGLNGSTITPVQEEAENQVMKGLTGGTGTLDCFLNGALYGMKLQNFFTFERGRNHWRSHARQESGLQAYPAWLAMEMYNGDAQGDFLVVTTHSVPTADLAATLTRPQVNNAPMASCYATRDGDRYNVFVLSRILDNYPVAGHHGHIPVTLKLPFTACTSMKVIKLTGDPRAHNLDSAAIQLQEQSLPLQSFATDFVLNASRGADDRGLPPASSFLYVFEGTTSDAVPDAPRPAISIASGTQNPTMLLPMRFDVVFSEAVQSFDAADLRFEGTAPVLSYTVTRDPIGAGALFRIDITSLANTGTVIPLIPAGACTGVSSGNDNLPSVFSGSIPTYDLPPSGGTALNEAIADAVTGMSPENDNVYRGSEPNMNLFGTVTDGWAQTAYLRFPVVSCLDRTITSAVLRIYKMGDGNPTVGLYAVANDSWKEQALNGSNRPPVGALVGSRTLPASEGYVDIDITAYVMEQARQDATVSLCLAEIAPASAGSCSFITREGPGQGWPPQPDSPPRLAITWGPSNGLTNCFTPDFDHAGGIFQTPQIVRITSGTPSAIIRYTVDGSVPGATHGLIYSSPVTISASGTLRAIALLDGQNPSGVRNAAFEIYSTATAAPTANPVPGSYRQVTDVALATATPGASIRFTLDGSEPDREYGYVYKGPINLATTTTLKAVAFLGGSVPSPVSTLSYVINQYAFIDRVAYPSGGVLTVSGQSSPDTGSAALLDDNIWSNWEIEASSAWLQFRLPGTTARVIHRYCLESSNRGVGSSPANWTFSGSQNGVDWTTLDTRQGVVFHLNNQKQYYDVVTPAAYLYYRLAFTNHSGGAYSSLGQFMLLERTSPDPDTLGWLAGYFTPEQIAAGLAGDMRDDDHDGIPVLLEYACGLDPHAADPAMLLISPDGNNVTLSCPITLRNDLDIFLEASNDLIEWRPIATSLQGDPFSLQAPVTGLSTHGTDPLIHVFTVNLGSGEKQFFRISANRISQSAPQG